MCTLTLQARLSTAAKKIPQVVFVALQLALDAISRTKPNVIIGAEPQQPLNAAQHDTEHDDDGVVAGNVC